MRSFFTPALLLLACLLNACDSACLYGSCDLAIYLTIKQELPDTSLQVTNLLRLDLRDYFQLGEDEPGGTFAGYPDIVPHIADTAVARVVYEYQVDRHGEHFLLEARQAGSTQVELHVSWDGGGDTGATAEKRFFFRLTVSA